jgi:hypothetical protein
MSEEIGSEDFVKAIDRLARTEDGRLLYLYFQKVLCAITSDSELERALQRNEGRRKFAAELMGLMAKGIRESGRHAEPAVTFTIAGPRAISGAGGTNRIRSALARSDTESDAGSAA